MTTLRPEVHTVQPYEGFRSTSRLELLVLLRRALRGRRGLIRGMLGGPNRQCCAMGAFWARNPRRSVPNHLIDEVAAVNDALSERAWTKTRLTAVKRWVNKQLENY